MSKSLSFSRRALIMAFANSCFYFIFRPKIVFADTQSSENYLSKSDLDWKNSLSPEVYNVLRKEGTERPFTSFLNDEKREGTFHCAGCDFPLFSSNTKFDSGTGWPSFWDHLPESIETKIDFKLVVPRTEYHCKSCGGHHGHIFDDGPQPTGKRYCNNGLCLVFKPKKLK